MKRSTSCIRRLLEIVGQVNEKMVGNTCLDYLGNHSTFTSKFFLPRDSLLGEIFTDSNFGSLGNRLPILYESKNS